MGCFSTGMFLSFFRLYCSPYSLFLVLSFFLAASQVLMFFISLSSLAMYLALGICGFVQGGSFTLIAVISHEDYGSKHVSKILGFLLTGGALGIFIFDELVFDQVYGMFASSSDTQSSSLKSYGKWNMYIFIIALLSSFVCFIMCLGNYLTQRNKDSKKDKVAQFVNF